MMMTLTVATRLAMTIWMAMTVAMADGGICGDRDGICAKANGSCNNGDYGGVKDVVNDGGKGSDNHIGNSDGNGSGDVLLLLAGDA